MTNTRLQLPEDILPMVPRTEMPQIDEIYYPDMLVWMGTRGATFAAGLVNPETCKSHQLVDIDRALGMSADKLVKPVLVSSDWCILDGNHRWYRHIHDKTSMPFIQINLDFFEAVKELEAYPKCYEVNHV
jgi:hypothetical protein